MDATSWNERYRTEELIWRAEPNRFLVEEVAGLPPGRALDVACGEGRNAVWLASHGWRTTGVDFSVEGLAKARRIAAERSVVVEWIEADVTSWLPRSSSYDLVLLAYVHMPATLRTQLHRHMATGVAPGGTLLVIAHDLTNLVNGYGGPQNADLLFTPEDVVHDVADMGMDVVVAKRIERPVDTAEGERVAIDLVVKMCRPHDGAANSGDD